MSKVDAIKRIEKSENQISFAPKLENSSHCLFLVFPAISLTDILKNEVVAIAAFWKSKEIKLDLIKLLDGVVLNSFTCDS